MKRITAVIFEGHEAEDGELCFYADAKAEIDHLTAANERMRVALERIAHEYDPKVSREIAIEAIGKALVDEAIRKAIAREALKEEL